LVQLALVHLEAPGNTDPLQTFLVDQEVIQFHPEVLQPVLHQLPSEDTLKASGSQIQSMAYFHLTFGIEASH
jgi:hypothetical protein